MTEEEKQRESAPSSKGFAPTQGGAADAEAGTTDVDDTAASGTQAGSPEFVEAVMADVAAAAETETMAEALASVPEPSLEELAEEGVPAEKLPGRPRVRSILNELQPGSVVRGTVARIERYGAFVDIQGMRARVRGLVHISELSAARVNRVEDVVAVGQEVNARVLSVDPQRFRVALSLKGVQQPWQEALAAQEAAAARAPEDTPSGNRPQQEGFTLADLQRRFSKPVAGAGTEPPKSRDRGAIERQRQQELIRRLRGE
jgi:predicted RNA-binding protein with RPS1 domain